MAARRSLRTWPALAASALRSLVQRDGVGRPEPVVAPSGVRSASATPSLADLRRLRGLLFAARMVVDGSCSGRHGSPLHDQSAEFAEYRAYVPGDDVRTIDWRAAARTDRLYTRRYRKETDMTAAIVLDCSGSMAFGGRAGVSKYEQASMVGAAIAYLMVMQGDRVGFCLGDDDLRRVDPASGSLQRLRTVLQGIDGYEPAGRTDLPNVLRRLHPVLRRRGLLIVASDLLCPPADLFRALGMYRYRGFQVMLLQVLTRDELAFPFQGSSRFVDPETGAALEADATAMANAYHAELQAHQAALRAGARARGIDFQTLTTETPCVRALEAYVTSRGR